MDNCSGTAHGIQGKVCAPRLTLNHNFSVPHFPLKKKNTTILISQQACKDKYKTWMEW